MDLIGAAWMIRDLGQIVSAIHIAEDGVIIAGGWDGRLKCWDAEGATLWEVDCNDRIESILVQDNMIIVTSGLHITAVIDGEIKWAYPLEGSSDMLVFHDDKIIATSSVFDIEHNDFMESAIWIFDIEGELLNVEKIEERPWFVESKKELIFGLGRPRCGILIDGKHNNLATDSPVTCGLSDIKQTYFGHADGTISTRNGKIMSVEETAIKSLTLTDYGIVASLEKGILVARSLDNKLLWTTNGTQITCQTNGFSSTHWCGRWGSAQGVVEVRNNVGEIVSTINTSKPRIATSINGRVGFGFEDGQIVVWEKDLFTRRSEEKTEEVSGSNSALAARLRSLRK
jgi:hypothetical protein